ncbi:EAL domain-containing protein [Ectothiorhodospiraceae bacterium WFHF3C12]|nr:EAL domain-containing protein [Ectothiorhodospiraceae bacterium WFHF3C12]
MACSACEIVPRTDFEDGRLLVAPAIGHTLSTVIGFVEEQGFAYERPADGLVAVDLAPGRAEQLAEGLAARMSGPEQADCRVAHLAPNESFHVGHMSKIQPFEVFASRIGGSWLADMIDENRLTAHFHPIVHAREPERIFAYESLVRGLGTDGRLVSPGEMFSAARSAQLMFHLDRAARLAAIDESSRWGIEQPLFINFNPTAIYDPAFCLRTTIAAAGESGRSPDQFVFEVVESDDVGDPDHLLRILQVYRQAGFRVALDDLGAGYGSLNLLHRLKPDFVKFDRELIDHIDRESDKQSIVNAIVNMARELGCQTVAEGIERPEEWQWLAENGADYLQGFYFAKPGNPPPPSVPGG